jgi:hypothetical protein
MALVVERGCICLIHGFAIYRIDSMAVSLRVLTKARETTRTTKVVLLALVNVWQTGTRLNRVLEHANPAAIGYKTLSCLGVGGMMDQCGRCRAAKTSTATDTTT